MTSDCIFDRGRLADNVQEYEQWRGEVSVRRMTNFDRLWHVIFLTK
jgi:hypothetical protein